MNGYGEATLGGVALSEITGFVGNEGAVYAADYTTATAPGISQNRCSRIVVWLRCNSCQRGYLADGAPGPEPCPVCVGGWLQPVALWDLRNEAAPPGMLVRPVAQEG